MIFGKTAAINLETIILYDIIMCESLLSDIDSTKSQKKGLSNWASLNTGSYGYILTGSLAFNTNP